MTPAEYVTAVTNRLTDRRYRLIDEIVGAVPARVASRSRALRPRFVLLAVAPSISRRDLADYTRDALDLARARSFPTVPLFRHPAIVAAMVSDTVMPQVFTELESERHLMGCVVPVVVDTRRKLTLVGLGGLDLLCDKLPVTAARLLPHPFMVSGEELSDAHDKQWQPGSGWGPEDLPRESRA